MSRTSTTLRSIPSQARSRETFERIMRVAAELLQEQGWDGFNTNALAQRANCRVSAVYRYFQNKEAVVATLAERLIAEWDGWFDDLFTCEEACPDIETAWTQSIDLFYESIHKQPGGLAIRRAMQMSPQLQALDSEDNERLARRLAARMQSYQPDLDVGKARVMSILLMESAVPVMDAALQSKPAEARKLLNELKKMHVGYIRTCMTQ